MNQAQALDHGHVVTTKISDRERRIRLRMRDDFPHYAKKNLKIQPTEGGLVPLVLNYVQHYAHERLERQLKEKGQIRALILKARKPGISTYVEARYYWKTTHRKGVRAYILTHEDPATQTLFDMVDRFYEHSNQLLRPHLGTSNAKELVFDKLDSGYRVGTAKTKGLGRSQNPHYFHGSEVAFWNHASDHISGILEAVPDVPGTEVILESTANGPIGLFYDMCKAAEAGRGDYILIFIPWFKHDKYRKAPPKGWRPNAEFTEYGELHGLDRKQLYWAFWKNEGIATKERLDPDEICWRFRQEYPADSEEAFQTPDTESFIGAVDVTKAMKAEIGSQKHAPLILGIDTSGGMKDSTWIIDRQGRKAGGNINLKFKEKDQMVIAGKVAKIIDKLNPDMIFMDIGGGYGSGVLDRLKEMKDPKILTGVQFGSSPSNEEEYFNKRSEMYGEMRDWLCDPGGADIPDDDELRSHLVATKRRPNNSNDQIVLEKKEDTIARVGFSPDGADALGLTFAYPVKKKKKAKADKPPRRQDGQGWMK